MELTINQLADLKIAIEKENNKLSEIQKEYDVIKSQYDHLISENTRLTDEVKIQADRKEKLIKENEDFRIEKQKIQDDYETKNAIVYKEIKEERDQIDQEKWVLELRLLEVDRREKDIARKEVEATNNLNEITKIKKEVWEEKLYIEKLLQETQKQKEEVSKEILQKIDLLEKIQEKEKTIDEKLEKFNGLQKDYEEKEKDIQNKLIEIWAKEKYIKEVEPKLENFKKLLTEIKNFVIESKDKKAIEQIKEIENEFEIPNPEVPEPEKNEWISDENKTDDINEVVVEKTSENEENEDNLPQDSVKDYEEMSVWEIKNELTAKWIEFNPNNNNKQSLIKLLMQ